MMKKYLAFALVLFLLFNFMFFYVFAESESSIETKSEPITESSTESDTSLPIVSDTETETETESESESETNIETFEPSLPETFEPAESTIIEEVAPRRSISRQNKVVYEIGEGITITTSENVFPRYTVFNGQILSDGDQFNAAHKSLDALAENASMVVYDITAKLDYVVVQPKEKVLVTFKIPTNLKTENLKLYYVDSDGKYEEIPIIVDIDKNTASAELEHFSTYVLLNIKPNNVGLSQLFTGDMNSKSNRIMYLAIIFSLVCYGAITYIIIINNRKHKKSIN